MIVNASMQSVGFNHYLSDEDRKSLAASGLLRLEHPQLVPYAWSSSARFCINSQALQNFPRSLERPLQKAPPKSAQQRPIPPFSLLANLFISQSDRSLSIHCLRVPLKANELRGIIHDRILRWLAEDVVELAPAPHITYTALLLIDLTWSSLV